MDVNFMLQDLFGVTIALLLFALIFIFPGYITGWSLDIFSFRERTPTVQIIMAMTVSLMIVPAIVFLLYRLSSPKLVIICLWVIGLMSGYIFFGKHKSLKRIIYGNDTEVRSQKIAVLVAIGWVVFSVFTLADVQIDHRLYFSNNSYDMTTRVAVVDAITRTGVPPINPSYYPGRLVPLDLLYYYWYILCSVVDEMGGSLVSAYQAMIASITWAGALLFATVATYLRMRDDQASAQVWKKSLIGIQLLAISGLDAIFFSIIMILFKVYRGYLPFQGGVEGWNTPIMSWLNALAWVPHHLVAALACMISLPMLIQIRETTSVASQLKYAILIGFGFASAFGLSVWVMVVFGIFWTVWAIYLIILQKQYQLVFWMCISATFGILTVTPFLFGIFQNQPASSSSGLPVALYVRPFLFSSFIDTTTTWKSLIDLLLLPVNYLFELGFFFVVALLWYQQRYKPHGAENPMYIAELLLVVVSITTLSFVRSDIYSNLRGFNDIGIRGWLPMQFVLVVWGSDLLLPALGSKSWITPGSFSAFKRTGRLGQLMGAFFVIGFLTTTLEFVSLRTWSILVDLNVTGPNNGLSPDAHLGERTFDARRAYEYLRQNTAPDVIIQNNPTVILDRSAGLYGSRQMVIADRTAYGVPADIFNQYSRDIGSIFAPSVVDWQFIDAKCRQYSIDFIIINDIDPLWKNIQRLSETRNPFYQSDRYIVYPCGGSVY